MEQIHSCSYFCDRPECIKRHRDELRQKVEGLISLSKLQHEALILHAKEFPASPNFSTAIAAIADYEQFESGYV